MQQEIRRTLAMHRTLAAILAAFLVFSGCSKPVEEPAPEPAEPSAGSDIQSNLASIIEDFENRPVYRSLDPETLASIPDDWLEQAIVDFVFTETGGDLAANRERVDALPPAVRGVWATWWLEADVFDGGFNQYFWNPHGYWADDAIAAYESYGASEHAETTRKAVARFFAEAETHRRFRDTGTLEAFAESYEVTELGNVTEEFWLLSDPNDKRVAYIRANPDKFTTD